MIFLNKNPLSNYYLFYNLNKIMSKLDTRAVLNLRGLPQNPYLNSIR